MRAFVLAALPWVILHHVLNYLVGGTFKPANAVAEYFQWPGCTFNAQNMTGTWQHANVLSFLVYAVDLLVGKRGFLGYNPPLLLAIPALVIGLRRRLGRTAGIAGSRCLVRRHLAALCINLQQFRRPMLFDSLVCATLGSRLLCLGGIIA